MIQKTDRRPQGVRAVIFDLDGTLLDTVPDLGASANVALRQFAMPERPLGDYRALIGHGIRNLVRQAVPEGTTEERFEQVLAFYLNYYPEHCAEQTAVFPGIRELIARLTERGYTLGVLSNKTETTTQRLIAHFFPDAPFRLVWGNNGLRPLKPAPDAGQALCKALALAPEEILYLGDGDSDMEFASKMGFYAAGAAWGYRSREALAQNGADVILENAAELVELLSPREG